VPRASFLLRRRLCRKRPPEALAAIAETTIANITAFAEIGTPLHPVTRPSP
jgi:hypothetical protein